MNTTLSRREFLACTALATAALAAPGVAPAAPGKPANKIIAFSKPFQTLSYSDAADLVADVGWDGIECPVRAKGQIEPAKAEDELPKLVEALKKRNLELSIMTTDIRNAAAPLTQKVLRTASKLGIKRYRLTFWKYDTSKPLPPQLNEIRAELRDLAALNKELGLQAGFQNHSGANYVGAPVWDVYHMIEDLDPKHMGFCFDIGHATLEGGMSWPIEARLVEPRLTAVYVKDFYWNKTDKGWVAKWCPLGDGMVNKNFFKTLQTMGYTGPISQHHEYKELGTGKEMMANFKKDLAVLKQWVG
ncbi:MAG: sugar phosphate isomerase/epimerase family protein [Verrucomicrobiota bacterium]